MNKLEVKKRAGNLRKRIRKRRDEIISLKNQLAKNVKEIERLCDLNVEDIRECNKISRDWFLLFLFEENRIMKESISKEFPKRIKGIEEKSVKLFISSTYRYYAFVFLILELSIYRGIMHSNRMEIKSPARYFDYEESLYYFKRGLRLVRFLEKKNCKPVNDFYSFNIKIRNPSYNDYKSFIYTNLATLHCCRNRVSEWMKVLQKLERLKTSTTYHVLLSKFKIRLEKREFKNAEKVVHELIRFCQSNKVYHIWDVKEKYVNQLLLKHLISKPFSSKITSLIQFRGKHREFGRQYEDLETYNNRRMVSHISKPSGLEYQKTPGNRANDHIGHHNLRRYIRSQEHARNKEVCNKSEMKWENYLNLLKKCATRFPEPSEMYTFLDLRDLESLKHFFSRDGYQKMRNGNSPRSSAQVKMLYIEGSMYYFLVKEELWKIRRNNERKEFPDIRDDLDRAISEEIVRYANMSLRCFDEFFHLLDSKQMGDAQRGEILRFFSRELKTVPSRHSSTWDGQQMGQAIRFVMMVRCAKSFLYRYEHKDYTGEEEEKTRERKELREKITFLKRKGSGYFQFKMKAERLRNMFDKVNVGDSLAKKRLNDFCVEENLPKYFQYGDIEKRIGMTILDIEDSEEDENDINRNNNNEMSDLEESEEEEEEEEVEKISKNVSGDDEDNIDVFYEDELILDEDEYDDDDEEEEEEEEEEVRIIGMGKENRYTPSSSNFIDLTIGSKEEEEEETDDYFLKRKRKRKKKKKKVRFKKERVPMKNKKKFVNPQMKKKKKAKNIYYIKEPPPSKKKRKKSRRSSNSYKVLGSNEIYRDSRNFWSVKREKKRKRKMEFDSLQDEMEFHERKRRKRNIV